MYNQLSVEECLLYLSKYGKPVLYLTDDGWCTSLEVLVNKTTAPVYVSSDVNQISLRASVNQCVERTVILLSKQTKRELQ